MNAQRCSFLRLLGWLLFVSGLQACQNNVVEAPDNLIPESKMVQVLTEIHLAEARVTKMNRVSLDSNTLIYKRLEKQIFRKYKVDTAAYSKSYTYYSSNPDQMAGIYKQVVEELERRNKPADSTSKKAPVNTGKLPARLKNLKK
ncbi:DUF4296 domain-containing protein [Larkinella bovis]|uniref:DUF4296 domain-containing protein n=1 Tax=Larkinella bovis TaxID=683041 RepID=A0ABW0IAX7_9BACT